MTVQDLVTAALRRLRVIGAVDTASAEDSALCLEVLNGIVDDWNAERESVYADVLASHTLVPATSPHTIGISTSTPTWSVTQRPVSLLAAVLVSDTGTRSPLTVYHGLDHWASLADPTSSGTPTEVSYEAGWPLGSLYFWPVPDAALAVELYTRVVLARATLTTTFTLAPGYENAFKLTLIEQVASAFGMEPPGIVVRDAARARARIQRNNRRIPSISTRDYGMPGGGGGIFDYRTGRAVE